MLQTQLFCIGQAGSVYVLQCYYAHGEENENFQRRTYWMLEEDLSHIVLVHYLEVQSSRANFNRIQGTDEAALFSRESEETTSHSGMDASKSCRFHPSNYQILSQTTDISLNSTQVSEYEDAESEYGNRESNVFHSFLGLQRSNKESTSGEPCDPNYPAPLSENFTAFGGNGFPTSSDRSKDSNHAESIHEPHKNLCLSSDNVLKSGATGIYSPHLQPSFSTSRSKILDNVPKQGDEIMGLPFSDRCKREDFGNHLLAQEDCEAILEGKSKSKKQLLLNAVATESLRKSDSFNQWMSRELRDVKEASMQCNSGAHWNSVENEVGNSSISSQAHLDTYMFSRSLSHEQLFSIIDFSPSWAYEGSEIKVLISGKFLKSQQEVENLKWSCMFGEVEVPAEVIANGVLRCFTPIHKAGKVPFYVTRSNRLACSEVQNFEYRVKCIQDAEVMYDTSITNEAFALRFVKLLCLSCSDTLIADPNSSSDRSGFNKVRELLKVDNSEWDQFMKPRWDENVSLGSTKELLLQRLLKEKLHVWLLQKVREGGRGPSVLDEHGLGVLHFAAALNYDWALLPAVVAGINVNFRDANGWTALHWAAFFGRERTVAALISLGAAPGALTDPNPKYPYGRTPAGLASSNGHKGIAGYLAESALSAHLESLNFDNKKSKAVDTCGEKAVHTASERVATPHQGNDMHTLSLKDSLAAVSNATQAAARIHEVMRMQSFQKKQLLDLSNYQPLSLLLVKRRNSGSHDEHAAAIRIQNKFRSWKGRKDFLIIKQRIVKIQAHVRGHQVRKNYRNIVWSVGILEKVILRWRRKGSGLRGFKAEALSEDSSKQNPSVTEDDDDEFFKKGRKQTEERLQKALARVKSMVQYPEARDQYRRLLNVVTEMRQTKVKDGVVDKVDETADFDDLIDIEALLDEDAFLPNASSNFSV
ncbi:calmodulin-binding transcription activator 3 isoform X4 [Cucurbita maxima]|uniref:Calmodulin-binding transcription activator 3 isoform X4 n=1 Tax=Cucurbita maxima TaxID=3661 RepID=A0A6J1J4I4_CUCMA|nr:calmodulin-binding transcription activator 3 isoform X4 [Cucurbita maxima]